MMNSEMLYKFDEKRNEFNPYGLTCELWTPNLMRRSDRHNEIEINYLPEGSMTYLLPNCRATIPAKRLSVFWGLVPHQIVNYENTAPYFVCTIPFSTFLEWKLPTSFVDRVLRGEVLIDESEDYAAYDEFLLKNWMNDINKEAATNVTLLEMNSRLVRFANNILSERDVNHSLVHLNEIGLIEQIAIYISQNYRKSLKIADIGRAIGLHPDYANFIFKKAFGYTLSEYITKERVLHAQRRLITTNTSITEIAFECGFNSISRFNAAFYKVNLCSPKEFRKRHQ